MSSLPGIVKIQYLRCSDLQPNVMLASICGALITIAATATDIKFFGQPSLKYDGSKLNGSRQEKSTLEFDTSDKLPEGERLAFVVTAVSGKQFLIGAREPGYPQVNYSETTGSPGGDPAVRTYKITHIAQKSVLPCVL